MKRDKKLIESLTYFQDDKLFSKDKLIIEFPKRYIERGLAKLEDKIYIIGIFAIIHNDIYSVSLIPSMIETNPLFIKEIERNNEVYIQFYYNKDLVMIENINVIRNKILTYTIFEELFLKALIPWYVEYEDLNNILSNMKFYADSDIGKSDIINEILVSYITRYKKDMKVFHRLSNKEYTYVALNDIFYSTIGTVNKIGSTYFQDGIVSALVQPENKPTKLEEIVRK